MPRPRLQHHRAGTSPPHILGLPTTPLHCMLLIDHSNLPKLIQLRSRSPWRSRFTVDHRTRSYSPGASPTTADQIHQHRRALHGIRFTDPLIHHAKAVIDRPRSASPPPSATATVPVPASPTSTAPEQDHSVPRPPHLIRFTDIAVHGTGSASPTRM
jgi:hypothetical protein